MHILIVSDGGSCVTTTLNNEDITTITNGDRQRVSIANSYKYTRLYFKVVIVLDPQQKGAQSQTLFSSRY